MPTRRSLLLGVGNALLGGVAVTSGAFAGFTDRSGDMRVVTTGQCPHPGLRLKPGRDDETYVSTDSDGDVKEVLLDGTGVMGNGLNRVAETRFERLVRVYNEHGATIDELYFEFEVLDEGLSTSEPTPEDIEAALFIASAVGDIPGEGSVDFLAAVDKGQNDIAAGEELPFGIGVDLAANSTIQKLPNPQTFSVILHIEAKATNVTDCHDDTGTTTAGVG